MDSCISVSFLAPKYWATAMLTPAPMEVQMAVRSQVMELVSPTAPRAVALMRFPTITLSARLYKTCSRFAPMIGREKSRMEDHSRPSVISFFICVKLL